MPEPNLPDRPPLLLIIQSLHGGGAERQLAELANYWANRAHVTLATWSGPEIADHYALDTQVRRVHLNDPESGARWLRRVRASVLRIARLRALIEAMAPAAVLSFCTQSNVLTILAARGLKTRVIVSERTQPAKHADLPLPWKLLRRLTYAMADSVVVQTQDAARWVRRNCWTKATVIPNALRELPSLSMQRLPLIVAVGRLGPEKGFDLLLEAFARLAPRFNDWNLVILGDGAERDRLTRLCRDLALTERVQLGGHTSEVETWMARAGLVVQPSRFEGFPNVVLESMGMGAAVISSDCRSGPADLIEDGVNGRLVPVEDVASLMEVMSELMSQPELRARLGRAATQVRELYRQDRIMSNWEPQFLPRPARYPADE